MTKTKASGSEVLWTRKRVWDLYGLLLDNAPENMSRFLDTFRYAKARLHLTDTRDEKSIADIIQQAFSGWNSLQDDQISESVDGASETTSGSDWHLPPVDLDAFSGLTIDMELVFSREIESILETQSLEGHEVRELDAMLTERQTELRQFLFEGELQEVLYRYRDMGESLPPKRQRSAVESIARGMAEIRAGMGVLDASVLVELSFTARDWEDKWRLLEEMEGLVQQYQTVFGTKLEAEDYLSYPGADYEQAKVAAESRFGAISAKADEGLEKREFAMACALVCLRHYGFAPKWAIRTMLDFRSASTTATPIDELPAGKELATVEHWINGQLQIVRDRTLKLSKKYRWPTRLLIDATSSEQRQRVINTPPKEINKDSSGNGASRLEGMTDWSPPVK